MHKAPSTTHYNPNPQRVSLETLPRRIDAAYAAAGMSAPTRRAGVDEALAGIPRANDMALTLARESLAVSDAEAHDWTEQAVQRLARSQAADELRKGMSRYTPAAVREHQHTMLDGALADLLPVFDRCVAKLTACAKKLPADPFDMAAIISSDTTKAAREAGQALTLLARLGDLHGGVSMVTLHRHPAMLLSVVSIPEVSVQEVDRLTRAPLDRDDPDHAPREAVRKFTNDAEVRGCDVALVELARGAYGKHLSLSLARDDDELQERLARAEAALSSRLTDSWGFQPKRTAVVR